MRVYFLAFILFSGLHAQSQAKTSLTINTLSEVAIDSLIKEHLVALALEGPDIIEANAQVGTAQYELKRAKSSWLNSIVMSGNINEFVIQNTTINGMPASTLFPKYNVGVNIPLGILGKQEKNISKEKLKVYKAQKDGKAREIRKEVLVRYENYKEKKELFELQKQITDGQYRNYEQRQKEFASREISKLDDVNKEYEMWVEQRSRQRTKEKELKVSILELEELIGISLPDAIRSVVTKK